MPATTLARSQLRQSCHTLYPGWTSPSPAEEFRAMADWCAQQQIEHDRYGSGALIEDFEAKLASLLGKPAAVFLPSGVMAQLIAMQIWAERRGLRRFGQHPTSHLALHEEEAHAALLGLHAVPVGNRLRPLEAKDLAACQQPLASLMVELPIRHAGGQLPSWDALQALKAAAAERGLPLHLDGARLWESQPFYARPHAEIVAGFASVYVSLYKGIGGLAGAVLAGDTDFIAEARLWQRRFGGTLVQQSPYIVSAARRFDARLAQMDACYRRAVTLAEGLHGIAGLRINPATPQTNMCHLYFDAPAAAVLAARDQIARSDGHWLLGAVQDAEVPGWSYSELVVGDQLLALPNELVLPRFARLLALARQGENV